MNDRINNIDSGTDERIAAMCRDVPVPVDLEQRLLASLGLQTVEPAADCLGPERPSQSRFERVAARKTKQSRRRWILYGLSSAVCLSAVIGAWRLAAVRTPRVNLDDLTRAAIEDTLTPATTFELQRFANLSAPVLPATMQVRAIHMPARQLPGRDAAVYFFKLAVLGGTPADARLIVVPASSLSLAPVAAHYMEGPPVYPGGGYCSTSWREGSLVYVCCVQGGENRLQRLLPALPVTL